MVFAEDIRKAIMKFADERGTERSFYASEVARAVDPVNWKNLLDQVRFVATVLVKEGKIKALKGGQSVDPINSNDYIVFRKSS